MLFKNLTRAACLAAILVALAISAGVANGQEWVSASFSVAPDTPLSKIIPLGTQNELVLKFCAKATGGTVSFFGATLELSGLFADEYFQEVSIYEDGLCLGSGIFEFGIANLDFTIISLLPVGIEENYEVRISLSSNAQPGTQFKVGLYDVDTDADIVVWPMDGIWSNPMTIGLIEIGSLKVVARQVPPLFADIGEVCVSAGAILQNSEVEPAVAREVVVRIDGNFAYGDLEQLTVGIGESGIVRLGPVEPGVYYFDGNWRFKESQEQEIEVSIFVKSGAGKKFSVTVIDIVATGETYGFQVPVEGLPIGGSVIEIVGEEPTTGFYGYIKDLSGKPLKATILAINEPLKQKTKVVSGDDGYYEITELVSAMHWLFCYRQYFYIDVAREFLSAGKMVRVDFVLAEKPSEPKPKE